MKKTKLMLLLVPALLLMGCNTTSNNNNSSSASNGNGSNSSNNETTDVPEEYKPSANIPDSEKGSVITAEQATAIYQSLNITTISDEQSIQEIKDAPALRLTQRTQNDNSSLFYKDTYSYGAKYSYFYYNCNYLPKCKDTDVMNHDESWHYDYVRDVDGNPVYFDLSHQIFSGWLDLLMDGTDVQYKSWNQYYYQEHPVEDFEKEETSLKSLSAINIALSSAGSATLVAYLQMGAYSGSMNGMKFEVRSNGPDDLWFSMDALNYMGIIAEAQIKDGKMVYSYTYTDYEKLSAMGGVPSTEEVGITKLVSELWFEEITVNDLEYPNEAFYKEQAGK